MEPMPNYWELRELIKNVVPRRVKLLGHDETQAALVKEKGRKRNYEQFNLLSQKRERKERLLDINEIKSFVEVSCRASQCPMPLNLDVWDGFKCPFKCIYCFANYWRASLYSSFFDNYKSMGLRSSDPTSVIRQIDELREGQGGDEEVRKALRLRIPLRFGIRFEDFLPVEGHKKVSLGILQHLAKIGYPVMINTKSDLLARPDYVQALASNPAGAAVHITLLTADESLSKRLDAASPSVTKRFATAKALIDAGVRVVLRIEPFMVLINDEKARVDEYIEKALAAGVHHMTWDTYSYSAQSTGMRRSFEAAGIDFDRMFMLTSDSQWLGSLMLSTMMSYFNANGLSSSTFDFGSIPTNEQDICCSVQDHFKDVGYNWGNILSATRLLTQRGRLSWKEFVAWVEDRGGFLSEKMKHDVKSSWNANSGQAYEPIWVPGVTAAGEDEDGIVWGYRKAEDYRLKRFLTMTGDK